MYTLSIVIFAGHAPLTGGFIIVEKCPLQVGGLRHFNESNITGFGLIGTLTRRCDLDRTKGTKENGKYEQEFEYEIRGGTRKSWIIGDNG